MKSFLENRQNLGKSDKQGIVSAGAGFQSLASGVRSSVGAGTAQRLADATQEVVNPNDPDAPKVEYVRDGETIVRIIVSFGEKKVAIDCQY